MISESKIEKETWNVSHSQLAAGYLRYEALKKLTFKEAKEFWLDADRVAPFDTLVDRLIRKGKN